MSLDFGDGLRSAAKVRWGEKSMSCIPKVTRKFLGVDDGRNEFVIRAGRVRGAKLGWTGSAWGVFAHKVEGPGTPHCPYYQ